MMAAFALPRIVSQKGNIWAKDKSKNNTGVLRFAQDDDKHRGRTEMAELIGDAELTGYSSLLGFFWLSSSVRLWELA